MKNSLWVHRIFALAFSRDISTLENKYNAIMAIFYKRSNNFYVSFDIKDIPPDVDFTGKEPVQISEEGRGLYRVIFEYNGDCEKSISILGTKQEFENYLSAQIDGEESNKGDRT